MSHPPIHHRTTRAALLAGGMAATLASKAQAVSVITYTDEVVFLAASGATSATGALPAMAGASAWTGSCSSRAFGSVTVSAPSWVLTEWTDALPGTEIAVSNGAGEVGGIANDGIDATFAPPVYSAGFRFYEPQVFSGLVNGCTAALWLLGLAFAVSRLRTTRR